MAETRAAQPPEPRLALNTPYLFEPAAFADALAHALDAAPVASLRLRLRGVTESELRFAIDALRPVCHSRETALLLTDQPDLVAQTGADGVHLERARDALGETRERLGDGAIIGAGCAASRHLGLIAGELGADYVSFHPVAPDAAAPGAALAAPELFGWWQDLIEVPVVAEGGMTLAIARGLVGRADFIAAGRSVWDHPDGPAAAVGAYAETLRAAYADIAA